MVFFIYKTTDKTDEKTNNLKNAKTNLIVCYNILRQFIKYYDFLCTLYNCTCYTLNNSDRIFFLQVDPTLFTSLIYKEIER